MLENAIKEVDCKEIQIKPFEVITLSFERAQSAVTRINLLKK